MCSYTLTAFPPDLDCYAIQGGTPCRFWLNIRIRDCPSCGTTGIDRDINAGKNILAVGYAEVVEPLRWLRLLSVERT